MSAFARFAAVALVVSLSACPSDQTTALIKIVPASITPLSLRVTLYGAGRLGSTTVALNGRKLPGTVLASNLAADTPSFRVLVDALGGAGKLVGQGAARIPLYPHGQVRGEVDLQDGPLPDSDGDGVPDVVDDCPTVPDPDQLCAQPDGAAPRDLAGSDGALDLAVPGADLAGLDLASSPLPDLAGADLRAPATACPAFAIFCDDFETDNAPNFDPKWSNATAIKSSTTASTMVIDSVKALHGARSAHVVAAAGSAETVLVPYRLPVPVRLQGDMGPSVFAFRAYLYSDTPFVDAVYFFWAHRTGPSDVDYVVGAEQPAVSNEWSVFNKNTGNYVYEATPISAPAWHCVELVITLSGTVGAPVNQVQFYIDQNLLNDSTQSGLQGGIPIATPEIAEFDIGIAYENATHRNEYFIDDIALANQRVGCE